MKLKNVVKKLIIIIITFLVLIVGFCPSSSYAVEGSLNDAQRIALVDTMVKLINEGNKSRVLRYSQDHRMFGYNFEKVNGSKKQSTAGFTQLKNPALQIPALEAAINGYYGIDDPRYYIYHVPPTEDYLKYWCTYTGDDINDTLPFDCSSLVAAAYSFAVNAPYPSSNVWTTHNYEEDSNLFKIVTSDMSNTSVMKPGDVLWKNGHVALYLGDIDKDGVPEQAEAYGFARISKSNDVMQAQLMKVLTQEKKTYIKTVPPHPQYNKNAAIPRLEFPSNGVMDAINQVIISDYTASKWKKASSKHTDPHVLRYVGDVREGRVIDVTNLKTTNPGDGSGIQDDGLSGGGLDHDPIIFESLNSSFNYSVIWPEDGIYLEDQNLATSEGYFYKGTPTYGQYIGKIEMYNWLIEKPADVLDWLIGFVTYGIKATVIGWTAIMENVISGVLNFGTTPMTGTATALNEEITVLNKVPNVGALAYRENDADIKGTITPVATLATTPGTPNNETKEEAVTTDSEIDATETKKKITIEDVLFNRVPILDVNFFDFENSGGQKLSKDSLLYKIKSTIAGWYSTIRLVILMGLLVALIYTAIKIAISVPGKKAEYKEKLIDWIVGFIIVFSLHYIMVIVINVNNEVIKLLDPVIVEKTTVDTPKVQTTTQTGDLETLNDPQTSLYEAIRVMSYDIKATTGITAAIMYMVLVVFMIRFVILYAKRLFVIAALTVISPIMGLLYTINKKKYKLGEWMKEYVYNVLIQFMHVVIYTAIIGVAYDMAKSSTFRGGVIALMALSFLFAAEKMVKNIFGFNKASTSGSLSESALTQLAAIKVGQSIYEKGKEKAPKVVSGTVSGTKKAYNLVNNKYDKWIQNNASYSNWENTYKAPEGETEEEARRRNAEMLLNPRVDNPDTVNINGRRWIVGKDGNPLTPDYVGMYREKHGITDTNSERKITVSTIKNVKEEVKHEETSARLAYALQGGKDIFNGVTGSFSMMAAIPMLVVSPKYGLGLGAYGVHALASSMGRRKIDGVKRPTGQRKKFTGKRLMFALATSGMSEGMSNMYQNAEDEDYVLKTTYPKKLELLNKAEELEDIIARTMLEKEIEGVNSDYVPSSKSENNKESKKVKEAKAETEQVIINVDKQEFEKALNLTLEEVQRKDVEKVVTNYLIRKGTVEFTNSDVKKITNQLGEEIEKSFKNITINNDFAEIVRDEIRDRVVLAGNYVVEDVESRINVEVKPVEKDINKAQEQSADNDTIKETLKTKQERRSAERNIERNSIGEDITAKFSKGRDGKRHTDTADDIRAKYSRDAKNKTATGNTDSNLDNEVIRDKKLAEKISLHLKETDLEKDDKMENHITKKELEEKVDDVIKNMGQDELIDIMEAALKRKDAINREVKNPKYQELMNHVRELKHIDDEYKELTGESMYKLYTEKDGKKVPKTNSDGEVQYESISSVVKRMRTYLVDSINYNEDNVTA